MGEISASVDADTRAAIAAEVRRQLAALNRETWGTPGEAAEWARMSKSHLLRLCRKGGGPPCSGKGKLMRFKKSDVDRWLGSLTKRARGPEQINEGGRPAAA